MKPKLNRDWPVLTRYDSKHLARIALPLGGIGTGTVSLGGRGNLLDWEIMNRPAKGVSPAGSYGVRTGTAVFVLYAKEAGKPPVARALEGALQPPFEGGFGATSEFHGLPRFRECSFHAAYPFGQVFLSDPEAPLSVRLEAFNPLVPADADASGMPLAVLRYVLINRTAKKVAATVCGCLANFIGTDGRNGKPVGNVNAFREGSAVRGLFMSSGGVDKASEFWGTMALTTTATRVTCKRAWPMGGWNVPLLHFWDDLLEDGKLDDDDISTQDAPMGSLAASVTVPPRGQKEVTFFVTWHFPNRMTWYPRGKPKNAGGFVRTLRVSPLRPPAGPFEALACPDAADSASWPRRTFDGDFCDRHGEIGARPGEDVVAYYACRLDCREHMSLDALLGYDGPVKVWSDGEQVFFDPEGTNPSEPGDARVSLDLPKGEHELVIALGSHGGKAWGIFLRFERTRVPKSRRATGDALPRVLEQADSECACSCGCGDPNFIGNYYTTKYADAWDAAEMAAVCLPALEKKTVSFVSAFCASKLPHAVKEAALFTASTLRTQTCFRTPDGLFFGWEGCGDGSGCCHGSCTHVWNYEQATAFLFGGLARRMREVEFMHATRDNGLMSFRVSLPIQFAAEWGRAAADGQMGCIMKMYRDWQLSGDNAMLKSFWPKVKAALAFCWVEGGWDGDKDGVMEGCQHNTMDVEYYGPNPQMQVWYLGALRAGEEMAKHVGDAAFARTCRELFERGSRWADENMFNGDYYEHEVRPPKPDQKIADGLRLNMGASNLTNPDFQLGAGCLVDQLVGQFMAHVCGLGYLLDPDNVRTTLRSIMKYNFRESFYGHFNNMRSFVLSDEKALLMATYPKGRRPTAPFPYYNEVMTGFEYAAAVHMLYEGQTASGLKCIAAVRARYDGKRRSPFNEAECGHHYGRAMAAWGAVLALTGFRYSGVTRAMEFNAEAGTFFWSNGYAWGTCTKKRAGRKLSVELRVLHGELELKRFTIAGVGTIECRQPRRVEAGESTMWTM